MHTLPLLIMYPSPNNVLSNLDPSPRPSSVLRHTSLWTVVCASLFLITTTFILFLFSYVSNVVLGTKNKIKKPVCAELIWGVCPVEQSCVLNWTFRENLLLMAMPMHNWACTWLKSGAIWEGTCKVDKWLYNLSIKIGSHLSYIL